MAAVVVPAEPVTGKAEAAEERETVTVKRKNVAAKGLIAAAITTDRPEAILTAAVHERKRERREERKQERREGKRGSRKEAVIFPRPGRIILPCPDGKDVIATKAGNQKGLPTVSLFIIWCNVNYTHSLSYMASLSAWGLD